ncbi:MAG: LLM class F420-dependent oxidoreductase [Myxococcales bacterium]|nr:LLM class F420-dependent oxidoreductase [Myxococcales bacterium]
MKYGISIFPTDYSATPVEIARATEERGFESLWLPEHSHIPVHRTSKWPGGDTIPKMYHDVLDPFVGLAAAAAVTDRLLLATGICLVVQRDPIQTAKDVSSLDVVSKGRFLFGVGGGWNAEEIENHGTAFTGRFRVMRERIEAMKEIWSKDQAEYHGDHVDFGPIYAWPKPVQRPHPPIHVGGAFPGAARRAIRYGDGWFPILGRDPEPMERIIPKFRAMAKEAGRDPKSLEISLFAPPQEEKELAALRDLGLDRAVFLVPPEPLEKLLPVLDERRALMEAVG